MQIRCPFDGEVIDDVVEPGVKHMVVHCFRCGRVIYIDDVSDEWESTIVVLDSGGQNEAASRNQSDS